MSMKLPLFDTDFDENEEAAVVEVVRSGWLTMGERTRLFEEEFRELTGVRHAVALSSCTAALHVAFTALGARPGDEVIMPSVTFAATANSLCYTGGVPVFADIESQNVPLVCRATIERLVTERTRGIAVVHYAGYLCDMAGIRDLAAERGLWIVEDCAHAAGAARDGTPAGAWGDVGCFSFFSNKNISTGEGGMLTTNRDDVAQEARLLRSHGMTTVTLDRHKGHAFSYDVVRLGYNYRPTEITAALGSVQLSKLPLKNRRRAELTALYRRHLHELGDNIQTPFTNYPGSPAYYIFPILLPPAANRASVIALMRTLGVQTSIHYPALHKMGIYRRLPRSDLPATEEYCARELTLPLYPAMGEDDVEYVVSSLRQVLEG